MLDVVLGHVTGYAVRASVFGRGLEYLHFVFFLNFGREFAAGGDARVGSGRVRATASKHSIDREFHVGCAGEWS